MTWLLHPPPVPKQDPSFYSGLEPRNFGQAFSCPVSWQGLLGVTLIETTGAGMLTKTQVVVVRARSLVSRQEPGGERVDAELGHSAGFLWTWVQKGQQFLLGKVWFQLKLSQGWSLLKP